ncbi:MAG: fumarylacetoacetate hydrolase family protein [Candidatus Omnitrophica bacterium]|nr:fumarylacetoacetate hydrolase family protein [Candidatus Omnitrophota bacterium]
MKITRFQHNESIEYGVIESGRIHLIDGSVFSEEIAYKDEYAELDRVKLLSPVVPSKVVCVGLNYKDHAKELSMPIPEEPIIFLKPPSSLIGPGENILYPSSVNRLDYEAELAIVIKKYTKSILSDRSSQHILGYTALNDVTARDLQKKDGQWTRAKSFDTFCPVGPYIATDLDADDLHIELNVNGQIKQSSSTSNMIFGVDFLVSFISGVMSLMPGDIIATGTPKGVGSLSRGDKIELIIEGIGSLKNQII